MTDFTSASTPSWTLSSLSLIDGESNGDGDSDDSFGNLQSSPDLQQVLDEILIVLLLEMMTGGGGGQSLFGGLSGLGGLGGSSGLGGWRNGSGSTAFPGSTGSMLAGGSGNAAGVAERLVNDSAASIMHNQEVPMDRGIPTTVCCANFVSACLEEAHKIPVSQHTNSVSTLASELRHDGWRNVSRRQVKPGDVCIVGGDEHVEIVASNENGKIKLVGSNNTNRGSGPQVVSYDSYTGNQGDVQFLEQ